DRTTTNPADTIRTSLYEYDGGGTNVGDGLVTASTDALGRTTTFGYDCRGRQSSKTLPDPDGSGSLTAPVYATSYDNLSRITSTTDPLGNVTNSAYSINTSDHTTTVTTTLPDPDGTGSGHPLTGPVTTKTYDGGG